MLDSTHLDLTCRQPLPHLCIETEQAAQPTCLWFQILTSSTHISQNACECVRGESQTEGNAGGCLGHRVDGWGLQDGSGIKGHSFPTGVCCTLGLARASQSFRQDLIRAEVGPSLLKAGAVLWQMSVFHAGTLCG